MDFRKYAVAVCFVLCGLAARTDAALLDLTLLDSPDTLSGFLDVTYNATTDQFQVDGFALQIFDDVNGVTPIANGLIDLDATVDGTGTLLGGSVTISGQALGFGNFNPLLTADLTAFGFQDPSGGELFEFLFDVTGGDLAIPVFYGNPGDKVGGLILNADSTGFDGTFDADFDNNFGLPGFGNGVSDAGVIPEPTSLTLMLLSGIVYFRRSRRA